MTKDGIKLPDINLAVQRLLPYRDQLLAEFEKDDAYFRSLTGRDHDFLGRVLKCHLIVEHYLDKFLAEHYRFESIEKIRLTFFQKASLLPSSRLPASLVRPGILRLNAIRNRLCHDLESGFLEDDFIEINKVLEIFRADEKFDDAIHRIEAFTCIACTSLIIAPPELRDAFVKAFESE